MGVVGLFFSFIHFLFFFFSFLYIQFKFDEECKEETTTCYHPFIAGEFKLFVVFADMHEHNFIYICIRVDSIFRTFHEMHFPFSTSYRLIQWTTHTHRFFYYFFFLARWYRTFIACGVPASLVQPNWMNIAKEPSIQLQMFGFFFPSISLTLSS